MLAVLPRIDVVLFVWLCIGRIVAHSQGRLRTSWSLDTSSDDQKALHAAYHRAVTRTQLL